MRITPAPTCGTCGREGHHGPKSCGECGGNMVPINTIPFFIALLVTGIPLAVGPATVLLIEFSGDQHGGYEGLVMLGAILTIGVIASAYAAVVSIIGFALLRMLKKRSLRLGVLYGLGTGAAIGATLVILAIAVV